MSPNSIPTYSPHPKHREGKLGESQWTITEDEERESFLLAWRSDWCEGERGFGLHLIQDDNGRVKARNLGVVEDHQTRTFVAKFVGDTNRCWHGYPADQRKKQDRPGWPLLREWITLEVAPEPKIRKIGCGQRCIL
jgi:hypothetical protein